MGIPCVWLYIEQYPICARALAFVLKNIEHVFFVLYFVAFTVFPLIPRILALLSPRDLPDSSLFSLLAYFPGVFVSQ